MAELLVKETRELSKDEVVDINLWSIPRSKEYPRGLKYSFNYRVWDGKKWVTIARYDNSHGIGDHRHVFDKVEKIQFKKPSEIYRDLLRLRKELEARINEIKI